MINAIKGLIADKRMDLLRVECSGIEWEFSVSPRSMDRFGQIGESTRVLAWLLHREDQMRLFGFPDETERAVFLELMKVEGVGPLKALRILGGIGAQELLRALDSEDLARLEAVPGLGKKTAQKLVFSLKGQLPAGFGQSGQGAGPHDDIIRALVDMGYDRKRAMEAIRAATASADLPTDGADREREIFRLAIVALSGS